MQLQPFCTIAQGGKENALAKAMPEQEPHLTIIYFLGIHIMIHQPMAGHLFVFRSWLSIVAVRINRDAAARGEFTPYLDVFRVHELDQVIHDDIDAILVEVAMIAKAEQIQLE